MKIITAFFLLLLAVAAEDCSPRNCGINPQYQWSVEECKCIKTCFPKTQEDCGNPLDFKLNLDTCECEKNCEARDCGFNPQYQWSAKECKCISVIVKPNKCKHVKNCQPRNCGINPDYTWSTEECRCVYSPIEILD